MTLPGRPDGRRIAFAKKIAFPGGVGGDFEIFVMNADGSGQRRLTRKAARDDAPAWSPDGRKIVFESRGTAAGEAAARPGTPSRRERRRRRAADGAHGRGAARNRAPRAALPAWSPDGRMIAYLGWRDGNYDVFVMNADGSGLTNVTRSRANEGSFAWSPRRTKGS